MLKFMFWILLLSTTAIITGNGAKILALFPHASESHFAVMRSLVKELARREHNLTVFTGHQLKPDIERVQQHVIQPEFPFWNNVQKSAGIKNGLRGLSQVSPTALQRHLAQVGATAVDNFLSQKEMSALLQLTPTEFDYDLIVIDYFYTDALLAFGHAYNKPVIAIMSNDFDNYMQHVLENFIPTACTPIPFDEVNQITQLGFWTRLNNIRTCISRRKEFTKNALHTQQKLVDKYFKKHYEGANLPSIGLLHNHLSVLLINNHVPLSIARPLLPNVITAGGLHIQSMQDLPWRIKRFLDESRIGVIYLSLGNEQLCGAVPTSMLEVLFKVLGSREERVLWTCHDSVQFNDLPKNLMIQHSVAQSDILAHPHVRVFITNGDLLALQEAIVRHVPMVGLPIFQHEQRHLQIMENLGVAVSLSADNLTMASLEWAIGRVMNDHEMPLVIRRVATEFRDRPLGALETCMYWIHYTLRHNHGMALKARGIGLSTSSHLHLFDLFVFYFGMTALIVIAAIALFSLTTCLYKRHTTHQLFAKLNKRQ